MDNLGATEIGKLKFTLKNKQMFDLAVNAFNKYSDYGISKINNRTEVRDHLNYFLQTVQIVSGNEGGFDAINTYDGAGISVGFVQFAYPQGNVYKLLNEFNKPLAEEVNKAFGNVKTYTDNKSLKSRLDKDLLFKVQKAIITPEGITAQFKLMIEDFYDKTYKQFLNIIFQEETDPNISKYKIYANAFIFDTGINQGTGGSNKNVSGSGSGNIRQIKVQGNNPTEGSFLNYYVKNHFLRPERRAFWENILTRHFKKGENFS